MADYNKVGLLTIRDGRILLCRKNRTTSKLILPGGCLEPDESAEACLRRELREELGAAVEAVNLEYLATYADRAATDDPAIIKTVEVKIYRGDLVGIPVASAEIVELVWFGPGDDKSRLAPSIVNKILPDLIERGIIG